MKISIQTNDMDGAGFEQSATLGISNDNAAKIFKVLTDSLYSAGASAMARELISNALDEAPHASGPLEIAMPTRLNPVFTIRDHGRGMSHDFVMNRAFSLGDSTKDGRGRNDGARADCADGTIGGFGLGLKTPFILADQFTITVYRGDHAQTYVIDKPEGLPRVQTSAVMRRDLDTPETGTEITVSCPVSRVDELRAGIIRTLQFLPASAYKISGGNVHMSPIEWRYQSPAYSITRDSRESFILLGPIAYPIDWRAIGERAHGRYSLAFHLPAGALEVTGSREAIKWTPRSVQIVNAAIDAAMADMQARVQSQFVSVQTVYDALIMRHKLDFECNLSGGGIKWHGVELGRRLQFAARVAWRRSDFYSARRPKLRNYFEIAATDWARPDKMLFLLDDPACKAQEYSRRIETAFENNSWADEIAVINRGDWRFAMLGAPLQSIMAYAPAKREATVRATPRAGKAYRMDRGRTSLSTCDYTAGGLYVPYNGASPVWQEGERKIVESAYGQRQGVIWGLNQTIRKGLDLSVWKLAAPEILARAKADQLALKAWLETRTIRNHDMWKLCNMAGANGKTWRTGNADCDALIDDMESAAPKSAMPVSGAIFSDICDLEALGVLPVTPQVMPDLDARADALYSQYPAFQYILDNVRGQELKRLIPHSFG